jgi:hypothetical protein
MIDSDRDDDAARGDSVSESEGGGTGSEGVDSITPQAEVSGNDPAGLEVSDPGEEVSGPASEGGVGDWDPASAGGGGGEVY